MSRTRFEALDSILNRTVRRFDWPLGSNGERLPVSEFFGVYTFHDKELQDGLLKDIYLKFKKSLNEGETLSKEVADAVADAILKWALERGVTHFCHWFQPQTGLTAEKHDAFLVIDSSGVPLEKFSGAQLVQSEPDASSFPSGGMRSTFEARGYTAWDTTSPIFIMETANGRTLCIPSVFISYRGQSLDEKTPLLRSVEAIEKNLLPLLETLGEKYEKIVATLGVEQEYFLIDKAFYFQRPDLLMTGRTLVGAEPPRGQQLEDHYFGSVPSRVLGFMQEFEYELYKLGIPAKTRHNEVAPHQFEIAPQFEEVQIACDHNQLLMEVMKKVADRHNFVAILHEKPFKGVNGSGKHNNWSLAAIRDDGSAVNLLEPGSTPAQNMRFLLVLTTVLKAVYKHAGLIRASIASAGNDHRLGANEAPPAIISVYLGDLLHQILTKLEQGSHMDTSSEQSMLQLGVSRLPQVAQDNTDRNRTSPFAFTGNKFEFRAVGSSQSCAFPMTVLNTAVSEAAADLNHQLQAKLQAQQPLQTALSEVIREAIRESKAIRFEGNNYSEEWAREAEHRGLLNLKRSPEALDELNTSLALELFQGQKVLSQEELESRSHILLERYVKKVGIELDAFLMLIQQYVLPSALRQQTFEAQALKLASEISSDSLKGQKEAFFVLNQNIQQLLGARDRLKDYAQKLLELNSESKKAKSLASEGLDLIAEARSYCDALEERVADEFWSLPRYREMLFLN